MLASACAAEGPTQISNSGQGAFEVSLASAGEGFVAAWSDVRDGNAEIYFRLLNRNGRPAERERRLTRDEALSYEPDIRAVGMNLAVAWYDKAPDGKLQARLGLWTRDGTLLWARTLSSRERNGRNPVLTVHGSELFVAWIEDSGTDTSDVWAGWWNLAGLQANAPQRVAPAGRTTWNLNADVDATGQGWVVFDARAGTRSEELFLVRVDRQSAQVLQLTADDGVPSTYPDLALSGAHAALAWCDERDGNQEVYLAVMPFDATAWRAPLVPDLESRARRVTNTAGHSVRASVASNGATAGLAWSDDTDGGQHDLFVQLFGRDGASLAGPRRLTTNQTSSLIPSIQPSADGFALAWNEHAAPPDGEDGSTGRSEIAFTVVR